LPDEFDTPFPDLPETLTQADISGQRHAASWAKTFEPSTANLPRTGTSLALRRQHRGDIEQYAATVEEQRMLAHQQRLMQDKNALQYELRSRAMDMKERMDKFNMGMAVKKLDNAEEAQNSLLAARAAQEEAAKSRQILQDTAIAKAAAIETDANKFMTELTAIDDDEGSPERDARVLALRAKYPRARLDDRVKPMVTAAEANRLRREKAAEKTAADEATIAAAKGFGHEQTGVTSTGRPSFVPPTPVKDEELDKLNDSLRLALGNQMKADVDEQSQYEPGLKAIREKITAREAALKPAPKTEIIERNGKKYEVDHVNKKVLRVVE